MLHIERRGEVVVWTIDRPEAKNALDHAMLASLRDAVRAAEDEQGLRVAVLTGAGDAFVSGGDLRELRGRHSQADAERLSDAGWELTRAIGALSIPVIAVLNGAAVGGGAELALACDLRVADARATIAFKQVRMGVTTAWGSIPRLTHVVGAGAAARLLFSARTIGAQEAKALGLVDEVTEDGRALATAIEWAEEIALASPCAVAATKRLLRPLGETRELERREFVATWTGADHKEAVEAYFERRPPRWRPR